MSSQFTPDPFPPPGPFPEPPIPDPPFPEPPFPPSWPPKWPPYEPVPLPPDWWWPCRRIGPVSGRYEGDRSGTGTLPNVLHLRVDIDRRSQNSPVMNRVSGDFYQRFVFKYPGSIPLAWSVYRGSWIVDNPTVQWSRCSVRITGTVRFWQGSHKTTTIRIDIPWSTFTPAGPASVTFSQTGAAASTYSCPRVSDCFRDLELEVDVVASAQAEPVLPNYDTTSHPDHPAGLPQRDLTLEQAYRDAGVCVTIRPQRTIIDDSAPAFDSWTPAELHDAMETNYQRFGGGWPAWRMWGLLAGEFENSGVGGIMFDAAAAYGGAGEAPDRQGFAVFRAHPWFNDLVSDPSNDVEDAAMRKFLYTWVHEAGHAFNLLHSWDKGRPDSLSWMNYDWKYDNRHQPGDFWKNFELRFDDEELIHIRHGDRVSVIMGGDPWASGGHLESPDSEYLMVDDGGAPLELIVRSQGYFAFMEPVAVELRLRNLLDDHALGIDARLHPEFGAMLIQIRRPDGSIVSFDPPMCKMGLPEHLELGDSRSRLGQDRLSSLVQLSYGSSGYMFAEPGNYEVRAIYQGLGDILIVSKPHPIRIGQPVSAEQDRIAYLYYQNRVGLALYLGGSQSPYLAAEMNLLTAFAESDAPQGQKISALIAPAIASPFHHLELKGERNAELVQVYAGDPERALALTDPVVQHLHAEGRKSDNLFYRQVVDARTSWHMATGKEKAARGEINQLRTDLGEREVKRSVLDAIELEAEPK